MEFKDYKVKDISLAEFGRKEIELAEKNGGADHIKFGI